MPSYDFEVHFTGPAGGFALIDSLYEAGWDDATIAFDPDTGGQGSAQFHRDSPSAVDAVVSAVKQGQSCGLDVTRVSDDVVTLGEIAERVGRTLAAVDHWVQGRRGPGGFPAPLAPRPRAALWSWAEVADWLMDHNLAAIPPEDIEVTRVCRVVDMVLQACHEISGDGWRQVITVAAPAAS